MDNIINIFDSRKALTVYLMASYPNKERFYTIIDLMERSGVDILELGIPVEEPYLDGKVISDANKTVLDEGFSKETLIEILDYIKKNCKNMKVILMTYKAGVEKYDLLALQPCYDALLCADFLYKVDNANLIQLYNETMLEEEIVERLRYNNGFAYVMSGAGKTGGTGGMSKNYIKTMEAIKKHSKLPIQIGFGISAVKDALEVLDNHAEGIIIGSEFIRKVNSGDDYDMVQFLKDFRAALDSI